MALTSNPIVDTWYQDHSRDERFTIVAIDQDEGVLELQYENGDLEEIDLDAWYEMEVGAAAMPEDWTMALDSMDEREVAELDTTPLNDRWDEELSEAGDRERQDINDEDD